jgi:hypothetical protein
MKGAVVLTVIGNSLFLIGMLIICPLSAQEGQDVNPAISKDQNPQTQPTEATNVGTPQSPPVPAAADPFYAPLAIGKQTIAEKFMDYATVTIGPRALVGPALSAAITMARPPGSYPHDWRDGGEAFGKNYGSILARNASFRTGRFLTSALLHEDFRYRPSTSKNPLARSFHAIAFTFVDRSDSGQSRIAVSNFVAAGAGGFVGQLYLPRPYNDLSRAESETARLFAGMAAQNLLREFAPDIRKVTRKLRVPFPRIPVPEWWTPR